MRKTRRSSPNPVVFLRVHVLAFPFNTHVISTGSRPCLDYLFLVWTIISKFSISTESILILFLLSVFLRKINPIKALIFESTWLIRWRSNSRFIFLNLVLVFFLVLLDPEFMCCLVHF